MGSKLSAGEMVSFLAVVAFICYVLWFVTHPCLRYEDHTCHILDARGLAAEMPCKVCVER